MKNDCSSYEDLMIKDLDDALDSHEKAIMAGHLSDCSDCRALHLKQKKAQAAAFVLRREREMATMPVSLPVAIKQQLVPRRSIFSRNALRFASTLTMVVLLVVVVLVYQSVFPGNRESAVLNAPTTAAIPKNGNLQENTDQPKDYSAVDSSAPTKQAIATAAGNQVETGASDRTTAGTGTITKSTNPPYVLYSGSLADLKPLQEAIDEQGNLSTASESFLETLPVSLAGADVLRVLTNPGEPIKKVMILAGYSKEQAMVQLDLIRSSQLPEDQFISLEIVYPVSHVRLIDLLGQPLYDELLPDEPDRQRTYLLFMIGG